MSKANTEQFSDDSAPDYKSAVYQLLDQISRRNARLRWLKDEHERLTQENAEKERFAQILSAQQAENIGIVNSREWKAILLFRQMRTPRGLINIIISLIGKNRNFKEDMALIRSSDLFDEDWYLANNPDVAQAKIDPLLHYLRNGGFEGRDPGKNFSSAWYLDTYSDVKESGINPLVHYLKFGRKEGCMTRPEQVMNIPATQTQKEEKKQVVQTALPVQTQLSVSQVSENGKGRLTQFFMKVLQVYRNDGLGVLLQKGVRKIIKPPQAIPPEKQYAPKVSIVIPVFNAVAMTKACIESIYHDTLSEVQFDVIVIDNASRDTTPRYLNAEKRKRAHLNVVRMKKNVGFGPAVNYGIQHSRGDHIVILNNDTMVSPGWLKNLLVSLENDSSIGIISPMTNYVGEGPQIDDGAKQLPPNLRAIEQYAKSIAGRSDVIYEPSRLVFFCVIIRRELVDMIGYLDEGYEKGNFEDDDYCLRARMAGYKLAIAGNSFVYHRGSATFTKNRISHSQYMERNRERFYKKAGRIATYNRHPSSPQPVGKNEVSVVIRTKNRPMLLNRALTSMANQTFKDFEVVLVNDGGEDITNLLDSFGTQFPIRYVHHNTSKGRTAALNAGIQHSRGKWLSYLDDDDIVYPWHLEALFQAAQSSNAEFVYSDFNWALFLRELEMTTPDILQGALPWEYNRRELLVQNYIPIHTWLHSSNCFEKTGLWDETFDRLEDYEFLLRVSANNSIHHLKRVTCEYRYYVESANSIYTDRYKTLDALEKIYQRNPVMDPDLLAKRQEVIDISKRQMQRIEEILNRIGNSTPDAATVREIIRAVVGL